eukprot:GCRY01003675.1.p1 GENE.GCRY01003675.1~~GCRY01003675.1.p1  ORF type:complete len:606 (+),score=138.05 GCRY01003675.1:229-2046(+)
MSTSLGSPRKKRTDGDDAFHTHSHRKDHSRHSYSLGHDSSHSTPQYQMTRSSFNEDNRPELWFTIDMSNMKLRMLDMGIQYYQHLTTLQLNNNQLHRLPNEIFDLPLLTVLDISFNNFTELQPELSRCTSLEELIFIGNKISKIPYDLGALPKIKKLGWTSNPLEENFLFHASRSDEALISFLRKKMNLVEAPARQWVTMGQGSSDPSASFKLMNYNILAEVYATTQLYPHCPEWALAWGQRKRRLLKEMVASQADIICLQEVQLGEFDEYFKVELGKAGYVGCFGLKGRGRTMVTSDSLRVDGSAIFVKQDTFHIVEENVLDFMNMTMNQPDFIRSLDGFNRAVQKDNTAIICVLEKLSSNQRIVIANTHLHWNPEYADVKLWQAVLLIDYLSSHIKTGGRWEGLPLVLCGDFNSTPGSPVYQLLTQGYVSPKVEELSRYSYGTLSRKGYQYSTRLQSIWATMGEPPFTNYTIDFAGVLDYVFFTQDSIMLQGLLGPVNLEAVPDGIPNWQFPSDHLPLVCELELLAPSIKSINRIGTHHHPGLPPMHSHSSSPAIPPGLGAVNGPQSSGQQYNTAPRVPPLTGPPPQQYSRYNNNVFSGFRYK